jgi:uncharacterized paraquat-inducible protein A
VEKVRIIIAGASLLCLWAGLTLPFFWMVPSFGGGPVWNEILSALFGDAFRPKSYSVLGGIHSLWQHGDWGIALVIAGFSVLLPTCKIFVILWLLIARSEKVKERYVRLVKAIGPWSMLDVFVVSFLVIVFKDFPGGTRVIVDSGYYVFLASVVLATATSLTLK